jgi:hypothetical protein
VKITNIKSRKHQIVLGTIVGIGPTQNKQNEKEELYK